MSSQVLYDVAIVGYGPVGATFANLLAQYGLKIAVVEQTEDIYDKPRAITIDHEVLRVFQACGLSELAEKSIAPHPGTHYLGVDRQIIKIFDPMPRPYPLGWVPTATFVQPEFERALRDKLRGYKAADVSLSTRATVVAQDAAGVSLTVTGPAGVRTLRARYLVACDGANSFLRKQLGIVLDDLAFDELWMVVDAFAKDLGKRPDKCFQYCWPSRPGTYLPGPGALRRWEIKLLPGEGPQDFATNESIIKVLQGFTDTSDLKIWRSAVYRFHALLAQRWRAGRIFLMGDAVHQTPPFLGQGLSAGIRDSVNLAWKLAFVLAGKADDTLLDSYQSERKPHVDAVVATAKQFGEIIGELDVAAALARDERLRAELRSGHAETIRQKFIPDLISGLIASDAPAAGTLFPQPFIATAEGAVRLDDLMTPEFAIVTASTATIDSLTPASSALWRKIGGQIVIVQPPKVSQPEGQALACQETEHLFADWLLHNGINAAIVRPDRIVYGGAADGHALNALIATLADCLGGKSTDVPPKFRPFRTGIFHL